MSDALRLFPLALLLACSAPLPEIRASSGTIGSDAAGARITVVNPTEGSISIVNAVLGGSVEVPLGAEPTRLAVLHGRAFVTLRGERSLVEVDLATGDVVHEVQTGPEPYGVVASPDGQRLYVSISQGAHIEERDAGTLEVLRTFHTGADPRWLAVHPDGHLLVVGHGMGPELSMIDLLDGSVEALALPAHTTMAVASRIMGEVPLSARVTGDPAFAADGRELVVPALYVDHTSGELGTTDNVQLPTPSLPYYRQPTVVDSMGRFNSVLVVYRVDRKGELERQARVTSRIIDAAPGPVGEPLVRQSYLTSVTESPDGLGWLVTQEASDAVLLVDADYKDTWSRRTRLAFPLASAVTTGRGPLGIAVAGPKQVYVHEALQRTVSDLDQRSLARNLRFELGKGLEAELADEVGPTPHSRVAATFRVARGVLSPEQEQGRSLFYDAVSPTMGAAGVSCSTCHFEGRTDGLTWELFNGARNTPSLAGPVAQAGVVTWNNPVQTVAEEARFTVEHRMGAENMSVRHADAIEVFLDITPLPDVMEPDADAAARGQAIFERADVGCAECHNGPHLTDGQAYDMYGLAGVKTRPLRGVAASAPYLHDGRAATLREVVESARDGSMGFTGQLSDEETDDLVAYLQSL